MWTSLSSNLLYVINLELREFFVDFIKLFGDWMTVSGYWDFMVSMCMCGWNSTLVCCYVCNRPLLIFSFVSVFLFLYCIKCACQVIQEINRMEVYLSPTNIGKKKKLWVWIRFNGRNMLSLICWWNGVF